MEFSEGSSNEEWFEEAKRWIASCLFARGPKRSDSSMFSKVRVGRRRTPEQAAPASESAAVGEMRKEKKAMSVCSLLDWLEKKKSISPSSAGRRDFRMSKYSKGGYLQAGNHRICTGPWDTRTAEPVKQILIPAKSPSAEIILEHNVRDTLRHDLEGQPLLAKTYAILFPNLINANLPDCKRWKDVFSATFRTLRNALKKVRSKLSRDPNIVSNGSRLFKNASKLAVGMVVIGNTSAVGAVRAMAPEAAEPGSLQAGDFEKWSNFWFGVVNCIGVLAAIITLLKSFNWRRRHSTAVTSAASAPAGSILNRAANMAQTLTVLRAWRETEYCEVVVARREEKGAYYAL